MGFFIFSLKNKIGQKSSQSFLPFGCFIWLRDHTIPNTTNHLFIWAYKWPFWLIIMSLKCLFPLLQQRQEWPKKPKGGKWKPEIYYMRTIWAFKSALYSWIKNTMTPNDPKRPYWWSGRLSFKPTEALWSLLPVGHTDFDLRASHLWYNFINLLYTCQWSFVLVIMTPKGLLSLLWQHQGRAQKPAKASTKSSFIRSL